MKELLFQYIVDYGITNEQHCNQHLKPATLVQLEINVAPMLLQRLKQTAFNQALQQDNRMLYIQRIINNGNQIPNLPRGICLQFLKSIADEDNKNIYQLNYNCLTNKSLKCSVWY